MKLMKDLSLREKYLIFLGGSLLLALGVWTYIWQPLIQARDFQKDRIARYLTVLDITDKIDPASRGGLAECAFTTSLGPRITQSAEASGMPLSRLEPEGIRLRITVSETSYKDAMSWIEVLEERNCVRAVSIDISRLTQPGKVSLRMTLEDAR